MQILPLQAIATNTTYRHEFLRPSLKCEPATGQRLEDVDAIHNITLKRFTGSGGGQVMYLAYTRQDTPGNSRPMLNTEGFVAECVMSDRRGVSCDKSNDPAISARVGKESITCILYDTHFDLDFRAVGNVQTLAGLRFEWLQKSNGENESFKAILHELSTMLSGTIGASASGPVVHQYDSGTSTLVTFQTKVMSTALIGLTPPFTRLAQNATNTTLVTHSTCDTIYEHRSRNLVMTYAIAIACSAFGVLLGSRALWLNGTSHETSFSSIMSTTRNQYLDKLTLGYSLGAAPTPRAVRKIELRFGELRGGVEARARSRAAFGLDADVVELRKGGM
ncbi:hypothetical protein PSV09DRAFT_2256530 [Bipolaris maydis]|nr:hypothetical protein J3E74DRAFT_290654 [Bipolaris maydis]KAJ6211187.1 hypothetical protein PSV09DRAFT_2256530 [Bipolaris maydis]